MLIAIFIDVSWWRTCIRSIENCFNTGKCAINCYFYFHDDIILIILGRDRIKLETRAEKLKEVERRSLRIVQVSEEEQDDNL